MKPKPAHYDAYEGKWFYTEEQVDAIIAELGQEVGAEQAPVAIGWVHEVTWVDGRNMTIYENEPKPLKSPLSGFVSQRIVPVYTSPAHTLEARDAARYRWIREKTTHEDWDGYSLPHVCDIDFKPGSQLNEMHETLDAAIDAAMRQEGGK